jgi:single-stranded-DNA-specific exonuclease
MVEDSGLTVKESILGREWRLKEADRRKSEAISQRYSLPEVMSRILTSRSINFEEIDSFLNPTLREFLPEPFHLRDMEKAVHHIVSCIKTGKTIAVFGDYDVDGATSSALLVLFFRSIGIHLRVHIPDRMKEGYGPNAPALLALQNKGVSLVITVDCGITAFDALAIAKKEGLDVIIIDHHVAEPNLPEALAIVNPNRLDETSPHGYLAAVGVTFLVVIALHRALRESGWYQERGLGQGPNLLQWLDIIALGTICDVVPLIGVNRAIVAQGIKVMAKRSNLGLASLADCASISEKLGVYHAGYILGPRVNAGGRVGESSMGVQLLTTDQPDLAKVLALRLDEFNKERQAIETEILHEAMKQAEISGARHSSSLIVAGDSWHPGVIGIIASRLKERFFKPSCVIAFEGDIGKGSGRSVPSIDLGSAIIAARQSGLLINGGGHSMAAGFTIHREQFATFQVFLENHIQNQHLSPSTPIFWLDGTLDVLGATADLVESLQSLAPYGSGNPEPRFAILQCKIIKVKIVGTDHVSCIVTSSHGGWLKAIAFRSADTALGQLLLSCRDGTRLDLAGTLRLDQWQGTTNVQLIIEDAVLSS